MRLEGKGCYHKNNALLKKKNLPTAFRKPARHVPCTEKKVEGAKTCIVPHSEKIVMEVAHREETKETTLETSDIKYKREYFRI